MSDAAIEEIVTRELRSLCLTCAHRDGCTYHKHATRSVIQCELFDLGGRTDATFDPQPIGLCGTCDLASHCALPSRRTGTWHCNEFE